MAKGEFTVKSGLEKIGKAIRKNIEPEQVIIGTDHEAEHTKDRVIALNIALDHLLEDKNYYRKLKKVGL